MAAKKQPTIPLPKSWAKHVRSAMLHVISLAQYATAYTRCPEGPKNSAERQHPVRLKQLPTRPKMLISAG